MGANAAPRFLGLANDVAAFDNQRFRETIPRTFYFTLLDVVGPAVLGTAAALAFARQFPGRGLLRTVFSLPMMATPVSIALIWIYSPQSVIATLAIVQTWQWTPFVLLIVLGGLAALPSEPYEAALIDGASRLREPESPPTAQGGATLAVGY